MKNIVLILALILVSCSSKDNDSNKNVEFTLIAQSQLHGNGNENIDQSNIVIKESSTWNNLISQMNSVNNVSDDFEETDIDFSIYQVIAVFDQIYTNGGHSIDIINITENGDNIIVKIDNLMTGDDTQVITQPFHIVKIPKTEKQVIFE